MITVPQGCCAFCNLPRVMPFRTRRACLPTRGTPDVPRVTQWYPLSVTCLRRTLPSSHHNNKALPLFFPPGQTGVGSATGDLFHTDLVKSHVPDCSIEFCFFFFFFFFVFGPVACVSTRLSVKLLTMLWSKECACVIMFEMTLQFKLASLKCFVWAQASLIDQWSASYRVMEGYIQMLHFFILRLVCTNTQECC